jgi:hypothetical protein
MTSPRYHSSLLPNLPHFEMHGERDWCEGAVKGWIIWAGVHALMAAFNCLTQAAH